MKKCIFYLPYKLDTDGMGARMVRPRKMINAFQLLGYEVFVISGYSKERKKLISAFKKEIDKGIKYDFMYMETHTMPMFLTDPDHIPRSPFLESNFLKFLNKHGIKIGLFYCDVYWKFNDYGKGLSTIKKNFAIFSYYRELKIFEETIDYLYVPDKGMCTYLNSERLKNISSELPPGAENLMINNHKYHIRDFSKKPLKLFYVGGIGTHYKIIELIKAVGTTGNCDLTICCRKKEWEQEKESIDQYITNNIHIVHKNNTELESYYEEADLCSLMFERSEYRNMAMPYKAFEYLAHCIPMISTEGTAIGRFVSLNGIGWTVENSCEEISLLLKQIIDNPFLLNEKKVNCMKSLPNNLWLTRAKKVSEDLLSSTPM